MALVPEKNWSRFRQMLSGVYAGDISRGIVVSDAGMR